MRLEGCQIAFRNGKVMIVDCALEKGLPVSLISVSPVIRII